MSDSWKSRMDSDRKDLEKDLAAEIEEVMKTSGAANSIAWVAVVGGAFVLNMLLLMLVAG